MAPPSGWSTIGGAPSVVLADGTFMMGRDDEKGAREQAVLNAANLTWTPTGSGKADANQEEGWTLLPDGSVLAIDTNPPGSPTLSERYNPRTGVWTSAGSTTVRLSDSEEMGPQVLRPDGSVIVFGALSSGVDLLVLPTGQIFMTSCGFTGLPQIYTPSRAPHPSWAPTISYVPSTLVAGEKYSISGTQFNGLSQGAMYGDEGQQANELPVGTHR
jgi:hypothetical protein